MRGGRKYDVIPEINRAGVRYKQKKSVFSKKQNFSVKNMDFFCKIYRFFLECINMLFLPGTTKKIVKQNKESKNCINFSNIVK